MRTDLYAATWLVAASHDADQAQVAEDEMNSAIGAGLNSPHGYYRDLVATIRLKIDGDGAEAAAALRADQRRVRQLQQLKSLLYSDPTLMLIDHVERHPELTDPSQMAARLDGYRALADQLVQHDDWWRPIAAAWNALAVRANTNPAAARMVQDSIIEVIEELARSLPGASRKGWAAGAEADEA